MEGTTTTGVFARGAGAEAIGGGWSGDEFGPRVRCERGGLRCNRAVRRAEMKTGPGKGIIVNGYY